MPGGRLLQCSAVSVAAADVARRPQVMPNRSSRESWHRRECELPLAAHGWLRTAGELQLTCWPPLNRHPGSGVG